MRWKWILGERQGPKASAAMLATIEHDQPSPDPAPGTTAIFPLSILPVPSSPIPESRSGNSPC